MKTSTPKLILDGIVQNFFLQYDAIGAGNYHDDWWILFSGKFPLPENKNLVSMVNSYVNNMHDILADFLEMSSQFKKDIIFSFHLTILPGNLIS